MNLISPSSIIATLKQMPITTTPSDEITVKLEFCES